VTLARDDEQVDDRGALAGIRVTDKQPIFLPDGQRTNGVFDDVVIETGERVLLGTRFAEQRAQSEYHVSQPSQSSCFRDSR
jgi:hypothetical protein